MAVDLAGHGLSSHRPLGDFYFFPAYVADVRQIVEGELIQDVAGNL